MNSTRNQMWITNTWFPIIFMVTEAELSKRMAFWFALCSLLWAKAPEQNQLICSQSLASLLEGWRGSAQTLMAAMDNFRPALISWEILWRLDFCSQLWSTNFTKNTITGLASLWISGPYSWKAFSKKVLILMVRLGASRCLDWQVMHRFFEKLGATQGPSQMFENLQLLPQYWKGFAGCVMQAVQMVPRMKMWTYWQLNGYELVGPGTPYLGIHHPNYWSTCWWTMMI